MQRLKKSGTGGGVVGEMVGAGTPGGVEGSRARMNFSASARLSCDQRTLLYSFALKSELSTKETKSIFTPKFLPANFVSFVICYLLKSYSELFSQNITLSQSYAREICSFFKCFLYVVSTSDLL